MPQWRSKINNLENDNNRYLSKKQCPFCKLTPVFLKIKHWIWRFTKVISKVGLDNEIQPPEDRDAIGKLSNKNNEIIIIDNTCISKYCANSQALSTSRKKNPTSSDENNREVTIGANSLLGTYNDHCA